MPANTATLNAVTKEVYEGRLNEQLNNDVKALKRIEKTAEGTGQDLGGRYVVFPVHTRRNSGIGARKENELLPVAGNQGTAAARVGLKSQYGAVQLTGQALELIDKDYQAFVSAIDLEMNGLRADVAKDLNRQVYGTGNGAIATIKTVTAAGNVLLVDNAKLFNLGDIVDVVTLPATILATGRTVTAIDLVAKSVTINGAAVTTVVGMVITRLGSGMAGAGDNREWTGIGAIVANTGTLYNIDPTVEPVWKAEVDANGGVTRALSESIMILMTDRIATNGGKTTVGLTTLGVRRAYFNLLKADRQYTNTKEFTGGFSGLAFVTDRGEIPIITDVDAPDNTINFLNEDEIKLYRSKDWAFMDKDGSKWNRKTGYDAYEATLYQYSELGTHRRNTHGVIKDITEA